MTQKDGLEELHDAQQRDNPCSDENERGYYRKRLRDLENGKRDETTTDN
jgi:hypothetical protein